MNSWRCRAILGLLIWLAMDVHAQAFHGVPNTPEGMLAFHGSAATIDWLLYHATRYVVTEDLQDDMETMFLISIAGNALGWALYMSYAPPYFYNGFMWALGYVQWIRLFLVGRHDANHLWLHLVRRAPAVRG